MKIFKFFILVSILSLNKKIFAQTSYESFSNFSIYEIIDELANEKIISFNTSIKPYKRDVVLVALENSLKNEKLNDRLKGEIKIHIKKYRNLKSFTKKNITDDFKFDKQTYNFNYKHKMSSLVLRPIWGSNNKFKKENSFYHLYGGLSVDLTVNKNWHLYAKLVDNTMSEPIALATYFTDYEGGNYKLSLQNDYSEMQGGIIYSFYWGNIGLIKDKIQWGDNYFGSNIFSGRQPSFPLLKLNAFVNERIELNYIHGWLVSEDVDSNASYISNEGYIKSYREKFLAANMISLKLFKNSYFSFGNSIIYSNLNGVNPAFLIPFFFYKSVDHTISHASKNQNSQLFLNFSFREINHVHLYSSLFVDELKKSRIFTDSLNNFLSFKIGSRIANWPIQNITNTLELNFSSPMTYKHNINVTTFESNNYNLGHYMRDNSKTINYQLTYRFKNRIKFNFKYLYAMHGDELEYSYNNNYDPTAIPVRENTTWDSKIYSFSIIKEFKENIYAKIEYEISNIQGYENNNFSSDYYLNRFTPDFYRGKNNIISVNFNIGF